MNDNTVSAQQVISLKPDKTERRAIRRMYSASGFAVLLFLLFMRVFHKPVVFFFADIFARFINIPYEDLANIISIVLTIMFEIGAIILGAKLLHIKLRPLFNYNGYSGGTIAKTYFFAQGGSYACAIIGVILVLIIGIFVPNGDRLMPDMDQAMESSPLMGAVLTVYGILFAPVLEELLFRGIVLTSLKKYNRTFAIIISGIAFGLTHGNLQQAIYTTFVGITLAAVTMRYNSIVPAILSHAILNSMGMALSTVTRLTGLTDENAVMTPLSMIVTFAEFAVIVGVGITALVVFIKNIKRLREFFNKATPLGKSRGLPVFITSVPWIASFGILVYSVFVTPFLP
jgi:membrane protease YdiL (CAAX protease family)